MSFEQHLGSLAQQIATLLRSRDGATLFKLLRSAGLLGVGMEAGNAFDAHQSIASALEAKPRTATPVKEEPLRIGIWEHKLEGGESWFVRSDRHYAEWFRWANVARIGPKRARKRIVLIGESVARGWFYDPELTPARMLAQLLATHAGGGEFEVVDLARTSLGLDIAQLAISAHALQPDCVVIFGGNNWVNSWHQQKSAAGFAHEGWEFGIAAVKACIEQELSRTSCGIVKAIADFYREQAIPIVWIVPEYNLADWTDPIADVPLLANGDAGLWLTHCKTARDAIRAGDIDVALDAAMRMIDLDGGVSSSSLGLAGACYKATDSKEARRYLEAARDAGSWDPRREWHTPRPHSVIQNAIRHEARRAGNEVVDVPALLNEHLQGRLPDRTMFLDHCHLTAQGMGITMAAVAGILLRNVGRTVALRDLSAGAPMPGSKVAAEVAFLSAVHNAHWWQPYDVVLHHCRSAVSSSSHIVGIMARFLELQAGTAPRLMSGLADELAAGGTQIIGRYVAAGRFISQVLETDLEKAVLACLGAEGEQARQRIDSMRMRHRSVRGRVIDLLDPYYRAAMPNPKELTWTLGEASDVPDYLQAYWPTSELCFIAGGETPAVLLSLTCRLPESPRRAKTLLFVNDRCVAELEVAAGWSTHRITVAGVDVREGLNRVALRWPVGESSYEDALAAVAEAARAGVMPQPFTVFCEIHSFTAQELAHA